MKKNIISILLVVTLVVACFSACKKDKIGDIEVAAGESAIYIEADGTVSYAMSEALDKDYYDKDDLKEIIENEIDDFNAGVYSTSMDSAKLDSYRVKNDVVTAIITFQSIEDFVSYGKNYNGEADEELFIGKIKEAVNEKLEISGEFTKVEEGEATKETTKASEIKELDDNIILVKEQMLVQIEGDIEYISANCTIKEGIVTITDDEPAYIVYK